MRDGDHRPVYTTENCFFGGFLASMAPKPKKNTGAYLKDMIHNVYTGKNVRSVLFSCRVHIQFFCRVNGPHNSFDIHEVTSMGFT